MIICTHTLKLARSECIVQSLSLLDKLSFRGLQGDKATFSGGFVISGLRKLVTLRTIAYIDGFNLYYGCLKLSPHCRWLDVATLVHHLISEATNQPFDMVHVKYFTAPVLPSLSQHGDDSAIRQSAYWRAIELHTSRVEIIKGFFYPAKGEYFSDQEPLDMNISHKVIRPEEKQTDVNLALHMLLDAHKDNCDQQVLVSNDSDYETVFKMIREHYPSQILGWIPPILETEEEKHDRQPNAVLRSQSHWSRWPIKETDLLKFQLPDKVITVTGNHKKRTKVFKRPEYWINNN